jgi:hypothetical protein
MAYPRVDVVRDMLQGMDDLDQVIKAVAREKVIRAEMARTGESREIIAEFLDAQVAMDQEGVLDLTDGQPTTLVDALTRYLEELEKRDELQPRARVAGELAAILEYPWPGEEERVQLHNPHYGLALHIAEGDNRDLEIRMGNNRHLVYTVNWEDAGSGGQQECQAVAEAVYRATLARVTADRDHDVQLGQADARLMARWLTTVPRSGSIVLGRVTLDACEGGGVIVRTRPFWFQHNVPAERARLRDEMERNTR